MRFARALVLLPALLLAATTVACGSDDGTTESQPVTVTQQISAAEGGTVSDPDGKVQLAIPPGALAADTEISVRITGKANGSAAPVYDFGPEGLTFLTPAAITIQVDGAVPEGKKAVLALGDGSSWKEVEGSTYANGKVVGPVAHFSRYTVIFTGNGGIASGCTDVVANFEPCGGDPTGTWSFSDVCTDAAPVDDPFGGSCPSVELSAEVTPSGTLQITADTVITSNMSLEIVQTGTFDVSCLGGGTCSDASGDGWSCSGGSTCSCTNTTTDSNEDNTNGYVLQGSTLVMDDGTVVPFCVSGDELQFQITEDNGVQLIYVAQRQ